MKDLVARDILETILGPLSELDPLVLDFAEQEIALYRGQRSAEDLAKMRAQILIRADAKARAQKFPRPRAAWRTALTLEDVTLHQTEMPYSDFFAVQEVHISHKTHAGGRSGEMKRAAFRTADAVTVLPYDPARDRVLLVEQVRMGPIMRGDPNPWLLEPIAGRIDAGQTPEQTAHREAVEEAGLTLGTLHKVGEMYPSGGALDEYIYAYVGMADLPDDITGIGGLETEQEDIASILLGFDQLMEMCDAHQLDNGPLYTSALWLARHRDRLRRA